MGWGSWGGFAPYVSKAEKIRKAEKTRAALVKKGMKLEPVMVQGRAIATSWWGKAWTDNLERYADYENRIPRGRTYVRSGAVLDLKITAGNITALVSGSRAKPYKIDINITPLDKKSTAALQDKSRTSLDSMQALLCGEFPADLKEQFFKQGSGLFPSPKEIKLDCSCPDWADMCKHIAAALYGTAVRLDEKPELFFLLRGININDFVGKVVQEESRKLVRKAKSKSVRAIAADDADVEALFGISMEAEAKKPKREIRKPRTAPAVIAPVKTLKKSTVVAKKTVAKKKSELKKKMLAKPEKKSGTVKNKSSTNGVRKQK